MQRLTLGQARSIIPAGAFPVGATASASLAAPPINMALFDLINPPFPDATGKWLGCTQKVVFNVTDDQITLPRNLSAVLGSAIRGVGDRSRLAWRYPVQSEWYQFLPDGPGLSVYPPYDTTGFQNLGDGFQMFRDLPSAGTLKIVTTTTETANSFLIRGFSGGLKVYTGAGGSRIEGETLTIPTGSGGSATTSTTWDIGNSIYSIVKPATNGVLLLYHVDALAVETLVARYEPGEKLPSYRRYSVPKRWDDSDQAVVYAQVQHVDVAVDNDEIFPGNVNALECALMALNYRRKDEIERSSAYLQRGIMSLNAELRDATAEQSWGPLQLDRNCAMGDVANLV